MVINGSLENVTARKKKNTRSKARSQRSLFLRSKKMSNMLSYFFLKETPWASSSLRIQNRQMFQNKVASVVALHHQVQSFHKLANTRNHLRNLTPPFQLWKWVISSCLTGRTPSDLCGCEQIVAVALDVC